MIELAPTERDTIVRDIIDGYIAFLPAGTNPVILQVTKRARDYFSVEASDDINPADLYRKMSIEDFNDLVRHIMSTYLERVRKNISRRKADNKRQLLDDVTKARDSYFDFLGIKLYKCATIAEDIIDDKDVSPENLLRLYSIYDRIYRPYMQN